MESLKAILDMNEKHPAGRRSRCITDLVARVKELEKENKQLSEKTSTSERAQEGPPAPRSAREAPTDEELIAFLRERPGRSLAQICERFGLPYQYTPSRRSPDGMDYGYTPEAKRIALQLQRLRKARKIRCGGMKWEAR